MLSEHLGHLIREQRIAKGLTQADLARAAGVSRTLLSRLERGQATPVQTDKVDRLLQALGVNVRVIDGAAADDARKRARLEQQCKLEQQRNRHLRLAIDLAADERAAKAMIAKACERVELWRNKHSCSALYIRRWSELLRLPPRRMAKAIASLGEWQDALFQNSPWSWAWN